MSRIRLSKKEKEARIAHALVYLREHLKPGFNVYTIVRKVSASGLSRHISLYIIDKNIYTKNPEIRSITSYVSDLLDYTWMDDGSIRVGGCGMDMCFHVVYSLGRVLWPDGTPEPHSTRNGEPDRDGGYALKKVDL